MPDRSRLKASLRRAPGWEALVLTKALVRGGLERQTAVAQILKPKNLFQPYATTSANRYPEEFTVAAEAIAAGEPEVLSFGCSSGEELLSLREYFPTARIHGVDVNPVAVRVARRAVAGDDRITVGRAGDASDLPPAAYDVVTALAVFRHGDLSASPQSCAGVLDFADFDRTVSGLARRIRDGGVLVIRHANFRFTDCAVAADFEPVQTGYASRGEGGDLTPLYGPDNRLLGVEGRDDGIYRRVSSAFS